MSRFRGNAGLALALALAACGSEQSIPDPPPPATTPTCPPATPVMVPCDEIDSTATSSTGDRLRLIPATFADLPGWRDDDQSAAVPALLRSCAKLDQLADGARIGASPYGGTTRDWRTACAAATALPAGDAAAARAFFEAHFRPYAAHGSDGPRAKLSGYYVQALTGSRTRHGAYQTPVLARPDDLVAVPLSEFVPDGRDRRIWGRVDPATGTLVPYPTRAEIRRDADRPAILWSDDPVAALFAEIEGSGKVTLDDGSTVWIAFAGKNGRRFRGVGGILRAMGALERGQGTMQGIRAWFDAHPERRDEIFDLNPAKVFFEESSREGAIGTQDVILTPRRSLAVDRAVIALSTPVWVDTRAPSSAAGKTSTWRQLLIAQDTGGAILGPVRGDVYWGDDDEAAAIGGRMGGPGRMWLLLPPGIAIK